VNEPEGRDLRVVPSDHPAAYLAGGIVFVAGRKALDRYLINRAAVRAGMGSTSSPITDTAKTQIDEPGPGNAELH
jgi:hypothetical protein